MGTFRVMASSISAVMPNINIHEELDDNKRSM